LKTGEVKEFWLEDANGVACDAIETIEKKLAEFGIDLCVKDSDYIFETIVDILDKQTVGEYRNHN